MSYKFVELQVAIPRMAEAAILQSQMQQKAMLDQTALGQEALRKAEELRRKSSKVEETPPVAIQKDDSAPPHSGKKRSKSRSVRSSLPSEEKEEHTASARAHPFKGHHIDMKL